MKHFKRFLLPAVGVILSLCLSACGYHYLKSSDKPASLATLSINTPNNDSYFSVTLKRKLNALGVNTDVQKGPELSIKTLTFTHPQPVLFNSGVSHTVLYSLKASWQLLDAKGKPLTPLTVTQQSIPIIHNANQFDTPSMQPLTYHALSKRLVELMMYRIIAYFSHPPHKEAGHATQS